MSHTFREVPGSYGKRRIAGRVTLDGERPIEVPVATYRCARCPAWLDGPADPYRANVRAILAELPQGPCPHPGNPEAVAAVRAILDRPVRLGDPIRVVRERPAQRDLFGA